MTFIFTPFSLARYLGTIGLFDFDYLKKGKRISVSEEIDGWLVTGRFENYEGIEVR